MHVDRMITWTSPVSRTTLCRKPFIVAEEVNHFIQFNRLAAQSTHRLIEIERSTAVVVLASEGEGPNWRVSDVERGRPKSWNVSRRESSVNSSWCGRAGVRRRVTTRSAEELRLAGTTVHDDWRDRHTANKVVYDPRMEARRSLWRAVLLLL